MDSSKPQSYSSCCILDTAILEGYLKLFFKIKGVGAELEVRNAGSRLV